MQIVEIVNILSSLIYIFNKVLYYGLIEAPKTPELDVSRNTDFSRSYRAGDSFEASCIVRDGRPVANISWYLGIYITFDN